MHSYSRKFSEIYSQAMGEIEPIKHHQSIKDIHPKSNKQQNTNIKKCLCSNHNVNIILKSSSLYSNIEKQALVKSKSKMSSIQMVYSQNNQLRPTDHKLNIDHLQARKTMHQRGKSMAVIHSEKRILPIITQINFTKFKKNKQKQLYWTKDVNQPKKPIKYRNRQGKFDCLKEWEDKNNEQAIRYYEINL